jgi:phage terminase small subunit
MSPGVSRGVSRLPLSERPEARARQLANLRPAPPPARGEQRARRHGGYAQVAPARLEDRARRIFDELAVDAPLRDELGELPAADHLIVSLLAQCLVRLEDIASHLSLHGLLDAKGNVRPAAELERRLRAEAADHARELGLSPRARTTLGLELVRGHSAAEQLETHLRERYGHDEGAGGAVIDAKDGQ